MVSTDEKYKAAIETHRHYDSLSITAIGGMFAVTYGCYSLHKDLHSIINTNHIFIIGAAAIAVLFFLYYKLSEFALIARNVSRMLESDDGLGVSEVYYLSIQKDAESVKKFTPYAIKQLYGLSFSIRNIVLLIAVVQIIVLCFTAFS
jgi:hypothetical protein